MSVSNILVLKLWGFLFEKIVEEGMFPCILYWTQNHFVVCYGITNDNGKYNIYLSSG